MTVQQKPKKSMHVLLWIAQVLLASGLVFGGIMKLFEPKDELAARWPWTGEVPLLLVTFTGIVDLLGAMGLVLPGLLRIKSALVPIAAMGVVLLMICAVVFHIARGEATLTGPNVFFALLAGFIAWGSWRKAA